MLLKIVQNGRFADQSGHLSLCYCRMYHDCATSSGASAAICMQVLQRLGLVDELMQYKEPGDGFHIARHTFHPLVTAVDTPVGAIVPMSS